MGGLHHSLVRARGNHCRHFLLPSSYPWAQGSPVDTHLGHQTLLCLNTDAVQVVETERHPRRHPPGGPSSLVQKPSTRPGQPD